MRHPFEGIMESSANRRDVLKAAALGGAVLALPSIAGADDKAASAKHGRYLVVPADLRNFFRKRTELGIHGTFLSLPSENGKRTAGFLAWLTPADAKKLGENELIKDVIALTAKQVPGPGKQLGRNKPVGLSVRLMPNGWRGQKAGTYTATDELIKAWDKALGKITEVKVSKMSKNLDGYVRVEFKDMGKAEKLAEALKGNPQVARINWYYPPRRVTTLALGEEAGGPTTKALGEEAGPKPTTKRLGEEGGKATTLALGEEAGKPTTKAAREEGGIKPTTKRVGEEGGKATTLALGEEGGKKPTTKAAKEEGGIKPSTRALGEEGGKATTLAIGEEGGKKPPKLTRALNEAGKKPRIRIRKPLTEAVNEQG